MRVCLWLVSSEASPPFTYQKIDEEWNAEQGGEDSDWKLRGHNYQPRHSVRGKQHKRADADAAGDKVSVVAAQKHTGDVRGD